MIFGVDVYSGYGAIDWIKARDEGDVKFAFLKCTEGNEPARDDSRFAENLVGCQKAGIYAGAYHFPYPLPSGPSLPAGRSPREQAVRAHKTSGGLGMVAGELPHVVDAEWPEVGDWGKWGVTAASLSEWLREYCEHASELWGRPPIIYTYPFWWRALASAADVSWAAKYPLWIANYMHLGAGTPPDVLRPFVPSPWDDWLFWQFSAKGSMERVPGIGACPVDRDVFRGSMAALRRLAMVEPDGDTWPSFPIVHPRHFTDDEPPDAA